MPIHNPPRPVIPPRGQVARPFLIANKRDARAILTHVAPGLRRILHTIPTDRCILVPPSHIGTPWRCIACTKQTIRALARRAQGSSLFLFDLHGTLIEPRMPMHVLLHTAFRTSLAAIGSTFNVSPAQFHAADIALRRGTVAAQRTTQAWTPTTAHWERINCTHIEQFAEPVPPQATCQTIARAVRTQCMTDFSQWRTVPGILELLTCARACMPLGILSNSEHAIVRASIDHFGLTPYFDDALVFTPDRMYNVMRPDTFTWLAPVVGVRIADIARAIAAALPLAVQTYRTHTAGTGRVRRFRLLMRQHRACDAMHPFDAERAMAYLEALLQACASADELTSTVPQVWSYVRRRAMDLAHVLHAAGYVVDAHTASCCAEMSTIGIALNPQSPTAEDVERLEVELIGWYEAWACDVVALLRHGERFLPRTRPRRFPAPNGALRRTRLRCVIRSVQGAEPTQTAIAARLAVHAFVIIGLPVHDALEVFRLVLEDLRGNVLTIARELIAAQYLQTADAVRAFAYLSTFPLQEKAWQGTALLYDD